MNSGLQASKAGTETNEWQLCVPRPSGDRLSPHSSGYPGTHYVAHAGLARVLPLSLLAAGTTGPCHRAWLQSSISKENCHKSVTSGPSDTTETALSAICPRQESLGGDRNEGTVKPGLRCTEQQANGPFGLFTGGRVKRTKPPNQAPVWMEGAQPICDLIEFTSRAGSLR